MPSKPHPCSAPSGAVRALKLANQLPLGLTLGALNWPLSTMAVCATKIDRWIVAHAFRA